MSKIEVNAIEPQCGTTLTLGASGDTVTLGSGASQSGFGRTGTVDWDTTAKTATFSAVSGNGYFCNTTAGAFTVNLPAGVAGAIVSLADYAATWQTKNLTVSPNGTDKIGSVNAGVTLNTEGQSVTFVYVDSTQGWINTMDSTSNVRGETFICASVSGACNTLVTAPCCANIKIATFTGPGTFTVNTASTTAAENTVGYQVVGGGGSGGRSYGGGGGAGGFREGRNVPIDNFTASPLVANAPTNAVTVTATSYPITVGAGGAGVSPGESAGTNGAVSSFSTISSAGGGGGADESGTPVPGAAKTGGSGGGGGYNPSPGGAGNTPTVSPPQGNNGGAGYDFTSSGASGGGGGGASGNGSDAQPTNGGGPGANGVASSITGSSVTRAGGGGGGSGPNTPGTFGSGGSGGGTPGKKGSSLPATDAGTANTGGGSGGGSSSGNSGNGGSGIVIIRYKFQ